MAEPPSERAARRMLGPELVRAEGDRVRLIGGRCGACARPHFPRAASCPYCSAAECELLELGPQGRLWLFTAVLRPPPGYLGDVPFGFGIVELEEGLRVVTRLTESDPALLRRGMRMRLVVDALPASEGSDGEAVCTYAFAPSEEA